VLDRLIFFDYYDGYKSDGVVGFDINSAPPGSTKHWSAKAVFKKLLTKHQFRSKGKRIALLAKDISADPNQASSFALSVLRPQMNSALIEELQQTNQEGDTKSRAERLEEFANTDPVYLFIFFKYYEGIKTKGEFGFSPRSGPPGSINHKRSFCVLASMSKSKFREKGKALAKLAQEFVDAGEEPSFECPSFLNEISEPTGMIEQAAKADF